MDLKSALLAAALSLPLGAQTIPDMDAQCRATHREGLWWQLPNETVTLTTSSTAAAVVADGDRLISIIKTKPLTINEYHCHIEQPPRTVLKTLQELYGKAFLLSDCASDERVYHTIDQLRSTDQDFFQEYTRSEEMTAFLAGIPSIDDLDSMLFISLSAREQSPNTRMRFHIINSTKQPFEVIEYSVKRLPQASEGPLFDEWLAEYQMVVGQYLCEHWNVYGCEKNATPTNIEDLYRLINEQTAFRIVHSPYK